MSEESRWYRSKVDRWLVVALGLAPLFSIFEIAWAVEQGHHDAVLVGLGTLALVVFLYGGLLWPMEYGFSDEHLVIRHGLVRRRVPLADIRHVHLTNNPLSSPALSLDRLEVTYRAGAFGYVLISPEDRKRFLDDLAARAGLHREGDGLVRRADS